MTNATGVVGGLSAGSSPAGAVENEVAHAERDGTAQSRLPTRYAMVGALGVTLVPLLVSAIALVLKEGFAFMPIGDYAQMELRVRDVGPHTPLTGLWSREDWNHPGPLGFIVLAPVYRLLGSPSIGLNLGALVVNGAALTGIGLVARRRGGTPLMLCTLVICGLMVLNLGADYVRSPWNPYLPVLSYGLLILLAWSMACGEAWALPVSVALTSFAAQTHVGFLVLGLPLIAWGLASLVWSVLRSRSGSDGEPATESGRAPDRRRALLPAVLLGGLVGAGLWLPPFVDTLTKDPTNAGAIVNWFRHPDRSYPGLLDGWRVMAGQLGLQAEWLTGRQPLTTMGETSFLDSSPLPWLLGPLVLAGVVLWRWNRPGERALIGTLLVAFGAGLVAVSRTTGPVADYRLQPTWWPGALAAAMALWVAWRAASARWPNTERRWLMPLAGTAMLVLAGVNSVSAARSDVLHAADSRVMARLVPDIIDAVDQGEEEVLVVEGTGWWSFYAEAMVLQLERHGIDASVPPSRIAELRYGRHRLQEEDDPRATLVVAFDDGVDVWASNPDFVPIAGWSEDEDPIGTGEPIADRLVVFLQK